MTVLDPITQAAVAIQRNLDTGLGARAASTIPVSFGHRVIEGFTIWASQQTAPALAAMSDTLSTDGINVSNGDSVTIGSKTYFFQTTLTNSDGNVKIASSASSSMTNLRNAINGAGGTPGVDYAAATISHPDVIASGTSSDILVTARGTVIDVTITTSTTAAHLSWENGQLVANNTTAGQPVKQLGAPPLLAGATKATFAVSLGYSLLPPEDRAGTKLLRIWADDQLIWDASKPGVAPDFNEMKITFHPGEEFAEPDATIKSDMGDLTPGFRDQIYLVIRDFNLQVGPTPEAPPPVITAPVPVITERVYPYPDLDPTNGLEGFNAGLFWVGPGLGVADLFLKQPPNPAYPRNGFNGYFIAWIEDSQSRTGVGGGYNSVLATVTPYPVDIGGGQRVVAGRMGVDATIATTTIQPGTVTQAPAPEPTYRTTLPKIRVELADAIPITPVYTDYSPIDATTAPSDVFGLFVDWDSGIYYAWTNVSTFGQIDGNYYIEHEYSMNENLELVRYDQQGSYVIYDGTPQAKENTGANTHFDYLCAHDTVNKQVFTSEWNGSPGQGLANSSPIIQIDLATGKIIGAYGTRSSSVADNPGVSVGIRSCGDCVVSSTPDGLAYGIVTGGFVNHTISYHPYAIQGGLTHGGTYVLNVPVPGFSLGVTSMLGIPIIGRKDLEAQFVMSQTSRQDWYAVVACHQLLFMMHGKADELISVEQFYVLPYFCQSLFWDHNDNSLCIVEHNEANSVQYLEKLKFTWGQDEGGVKPIFMGQAYLEALPVLIGTGSYEEQALRESRFDDGLMVFPGGGVGNGHWFTIDLGTGKLVQTVPKDNFAVSQWIYDSHTGKAFVTDAGNEAAPAAITQVTAGVGASIPLSDILTWLMLLAGYSSSDISVTGIDDVVQGGVISTKVGLWSYLRNLSVVYNFQFYESEGKIKFSRGTSGDASTAAYTIDIDSLGLADGSEGDLHENVITTLAAPNELAGGVEVGYLDSDFDYQQNARAFQRARFPFRDAKPAANASYETYFVMSGSEALQRAAQASFVAYAEGVVQNLSLPFQFGKLEPSDSLNLIINDTAYLVSLKEIVFNTDWSLNLTGTNFNYRNAVNVKADKPLGLTQNTPGPSDSLPLVLDVPLPAASDDPGQTFAQLFTGVESLGQAWWNGATLNVLTPDAGGWSKVFYTTAQVPYGRLGSVLPPTDIPFQTDNDTLLEVVGVSMTGAGTSTIPDADFWAGTNAAFVGRPGRWELIYYENLTWVNSRRVQVSKILRGRRGTEINCNNHLASDLFIPFNRLRMKSWPMAVSYLGESIAWSAVGQGTTKAAEVELDTLEGNSLKPYAITYVKAVLQ